MTVNFSGTWSNAKAIVEFPILTPSSSTPRIEAGFEPVATRIRLALSSTGVPSTIAWTKFGPMIIPRPRYPTTLFFLKSRSIPPVSVWTIWSLRFIIAPKSSCTWLT